MKLRKVFVSSRLFGSYAVMTDPAFARNGNDERRIQELLRRRNLKRLKVRGVVCLESVDSTQSFIENVLHSLTEGDIVISRVQTEGRGRENRVWISQEGGLWISMTLVPPSIEFLPRIPSMATEAVVQTLENSGLKDCYVKPPNDVYCRGKKIAGVLADGQVIGMSAIAYLGIGININNDPSLSNDISKIATSFVRETGHSLDLVEFAVSLIENIDRVYDRILDAA